MPDPAAAVILAALSTITVPFTLRFVVGLVPPKNPAAIPDGSNPLLFRMVPELMLPAADTVTKAPESSEIEVASLIASIPELPDVITSPLDVVTTMSPGPKLCAPIPYGALSVETGAVALCVAVILAA